MSLNERAITSEVTTSLGLLQAQIEPGVQSGSMGRAAIAWLMRHGLGYTYDEIASAMCWSAGRSAEYAIEHVRKGRWDDHRHFAGQTMESYLYSRLYCLKEQSNPQGSRYGHTPND